MPPVTVPLGTTDLSRPSRRPLGRLLLDPLSTATTPAHCAKIRHLCTTDDFWASNVDLVLTSSGNCKTVTQMSRVFQ